MSKNATTQKVRGINEAFDSKLDAVLLHSKGHRPSAIEQICMTLNLDWLPSANGSASKWSCVLGVYQIWHTVAVEQQRDWNKAFILNCQL